MYNVNTAPYATLLETLQRSGNQTWTRQLACALVGSFMLTVSAKVVVPFYPVPMTLQTLVVLLLGMWLGPRLAIVTVGLYLVQGAAGLPVFAGTPEKGLGLAYLVGPTGGYLIGFLIAAPVVGILARQGWDRSAPATIVAMLLGNTIIYLFGLVWLGSAVGWDKPVLQWGLYPFLAGDLLKLSLAALVAPAAWWAVVRWNGR